MHIFNARPIAKIVAKEVHEKVVDFSVEADNKLTLRSETKIDHSMRNKNSSKANPLSGSMDNHLGNAGDLGSGNKRKELQDEKDVDAAENTNISEKRMKNKLKLQQNEIRITNNAEALDVNPEEAKKLKHKKQKTNQLANQDPDKKSRKTFKGDKVNIIDSAESPFMDLFVTGAPKVPLETADNKLDRKTEQAIDAVSALVTRPTKKKKRNRAVDPAALDLSQVDEIGLGGPSAWDI